MALVPHPPPAGQLIQCHPLKKPRTDIRTASFGPSGSNLIIKVIEADFRKSRLMTCPEREPESAVSPLPVRWLLYYAT